MSNQDATTHHQQQQQQQEQQQEQRSIELCQIIDEALELVEGEFDFDDDDEFNATVCQSDDEKSQ